MTRPPHFGLHVRRWSDLGFDIQAAIDRFKAVKIAFENAGAKDRISLALAYCQEEEAIARRSGLDEADPDFWRIMALPRLWDTLG